MSSNLAFILTFAAMMLVIILLSGSLQGCTQLDKSNTRSDIWHISLISTDEECRIAVDRGIEGRTTDDSIRVDQPKKPM